MENAKLENVTSYLALRQLGAVGGRHLALAYANIAMAYVMLLVFVFLLFLNKAKLPKRAQMV